MRKAYTKMNTWGKCFQEKVANICLSIQEVRSLTDFQHSYQRHSDLGAKNDRPTIDSLAGCQLRMRVSTKANQTLNFTELGSFRR